MAQDLYDTIIVGAGTESGLRSRLNLTFSTSKSTVPALKGKRPAGIIGLSIEEIENMLREKAWKNISVEAVN